MKFWISLLSLLLFLFLGKLKAESVDEQKKVDEEKRQEYQTKPPDTAPIDELSGYIDRVFHQVHQRVKSGIYHSDKSAQDLKTYLDKLQVDLDNEMKAQQLNKVKPTKEELRQKKKLLEKMRAHLKLLGDEVFQEVQKTNQKLQQLSDDADREGKK